MKTTINTCKSNTEPERIKDSHGFDWKKFHEFEEENMSAIDNHEKEFGADGYRAFPGNE